MSDDIPNGLATVQDELELWGLDNTGDMIGFPVCLQAREKRALLDEHRAEVHARYRSRR